MSRNYASPYAKPGMQYPSQSEDYLSLEIGGPGKSSTPARPCNNTDNSGPSGGNYYHNKQRGRGDTYNRLYGGFSGRKNRNNFGERCNQQSQQGHGRGQWQEQPQQSNSGRWNSSDGNGQRRWRGAGQHRPQQNRQAFNRAKDTRAFVHPSMLEDPWKELMARHDAIKRSQLILQTPAKEAKESAEEATNASDTDTETLCPE